MRFRALALSFALLAGPLACKSSEPTAFSSGTKNGKKRDVKKIDKSNGKDIANATRPSNAVTKGSFAVWTEPKDPSPGQTYQIFIEVTVPSSVTSLTASDLSGKVIGTDGYTQEFGNAGTKSCSSAGSSDPGGGPVKSEDDLGDEALPALGPVKGGEKFADTSEDIALHGGKPTPKQKLGLQEECFDEGGYEAFKFSNGVGLLSVFVPGADSLVKDTVDVRSQVLNEQQTIEIVF